MEQDKSPRRVTPLGLNHLVLNVRDLDESHRFWTEILGLVQVGERHRTPQRLNPPKMRFYSGDHGGKMNHHDIALVENRDPPAPKEWSMFGTALAVNHIAIALPDREAWLRQLESLQARGVKFDRRVNHGMTHSLYIYDPNGYGIELLYELPRAVWERRYRRRAQLGRAIADRGQRSACRPRRRRACVRPGGRRRLVRGSERIPISRTMSFRDTRRAGPGTYEHRLLRALKDLCSWVPGSRAVPAPRNGAKPGKFTL